MTSSEIDLEEQLKEAGNKLLDQTSSVDELLKLLDELLRQAEMDVKVTVASCITGIMRITAPDAPIMIGK
jgi:hypothetical protein